MRTARWHLVSEGNGEKRWQLFDVQSDQSEMTDVAAQQPEVVNRLDASYDEWWASLPPFLVNETAIGPKTNSFKELYWKQFGGGPTDR